MIKPEDIMIETFRSAALGTGRLSKAERNVRMTHLPTGITVEHGDHWSQHANRKACERELIEKVKNYKKNFR